MAQVAAMNGALASTSAGFAGAAAAGAGFGRSLNGVRPDRFGTRMQYLGRQLQYSFTIPILAAGAAAVKWALDNEKAMTRVTKVYGDAQHGADFYAKEVQALGRSFEALSNAFGVNRAEVINIAADWAAAGASGLALAKATKLTLETMILGEMDAKTATKALIAIQAQYGLSTKELTEAIAVLNMVENQTGASLADLIDGFSRSAGVARSAGVDVRHLAAMMAALVPATGSAAQAGNALKTIFSRLLSPTKEAKEVLGLMNINIDDMAWKGANVTDRLMLMAKAFDGLSDSQKGVVASVVASRWQINKFEVLMRELLSSTGYYARALDATSDRQAVFNQMQKELNAVLSSNPRRLQVIWTMLQNAMADIIQPMIPLLLAMASALQNMVKAFSNLDPGLQKFILGTVLILAIAGPIVMYLGALKILFFELGGALVFLLKPIGLVIAGFRMILGLNVLSWAAAAGNAIFMLGLRAVVGLTIFSRAIPGFLATTGIAIFAGVNYILKGIAFMGPAMLAIMYQAGMAMRALWAVTMLAIQLTIIGGARVIGIIWRAMHVGMLGFTTYILPAMAFAWTRFVAAMQLIIIGFARFAGFAWRAMFLSMLATTVAFGKFMTGGLVTIFTRIVPLVRAGAAAIAAAFSGPWGWAILAVIAVIGVFHKQIAAIWNNLVAFFKGNAGALAAAVSPIAGVFVAARNLIQRAFNSLPAGVRAALIAVVNIMRAAAMAVYRLMSYLNPFARHSPSLVENVQNGMAIIRQEYASVAGAGKSFADAGSDLRAFGLAVREIQRAADAREWAELREELAKLAPGALTTFDRLVAALNPLKDQLFEINLALQAQEDVVNALKGPLNAANAAYEEQDRILQGLKDTAQGYEDQLNAAKDRLNDFATAPIEGMKEMNDAIWNNQMAQKQLQYEMMKMEQAIGPLDKLQSKINAINGEIEMLHGEQNDLRQAGAGSDILSQYDDQIDLLHQQQQAIEDQVKPLQDMQDALDDLAQQSQMLDLENSLKFDPLKKQIDDLANSMEELPFEDIIAGMQAAQADVDLYTQKLEEANAAVTQQQAVVDALKATRDALQATYDIENAKLEEIKDQYSDVEERIRAIEQAFRDVGSAAKDALGSGGAGGGGGGMSPGAENFLGAAGGDFPEVGGAGGLGREGGLDDQADMIDAFTKDLADKTKNMFGLFNFLDPIKRGWNSAMKWLGDTLGPSFAFIGDMFSAAFNKVPNPFSGIDFAKGRQVLSDAGKFIAEWVDRIGKIFGPIFKDIIDNIWPALQGAFKDIGAELVKFKDSAGPIMELIKQQMAVTLPILGAIIAVIVLIISTLLQMFAGVIGPVIRMVGEIAAAVIQIFRGIIDFFVAVFTGQWGDALSAFVSIWAGTWDLVFAILKGLVTAIWGMIKGFVEGIVNWFKWLWDILVGHSIIPDIVNGIIAWFGIMRDFLLNVMQAVVNFIRGRWEDIVGVFNWARGAVSGAVEAVKGVINTIISAISNVWNNVSYYVNLIVGAFNGLRGRFSFGGLFDGIIGAFRSAINSVIGKWNSMSFGIGDVKIGTPDIPFFARGGMITDGPMAIVGEGRQAFPEYVIPTDPNYRNRAISLFLSLGKALGLGTSYSNTILASILAGQEHGMFGQRVQAFASGGVLGAGGRAMAGRGGIIIAPVTKTYHINFNGNLEFPNVKSGSDAQTFLDNLEALIGD